MKLPVFPSFRLRRTSERPRFALRVRNFFMLLAWCAVCTVLGMAGYLLAGRVDHFVRRSDFFAVREVRIVGATQALNAQIQDVVSTLRDRGENNLVTFSVERAGFQVQNLPRVKQVVFRKVYPNTLAVDIVERRPVTVANIGELYWIDREGVLLGRADARDVAERGVPLLTGLRGSSFHAGLRVEQPRLAEVLEAIDFLQTHEPGLADRFSEWNINAENEVTGILRGGVEVRFGERHPLDRLPVLDALFESKGDLAQYTYFDLRFDSQVVYL